jgi:hypothetical protein
MLAVPEETVVMLAGVASVFTVDKQTREVKQTNISVGEREGKFLEVTGGLKGDEMLAASNLNQLVSGMRLSSGERRGRGGADESTGNVEGSPAPSGGADSKAVAPADGKDGAKGSGEGRKRGERGGRGQRNGGSQPEGDNQ